MSYRMELKVLMLAASMMTALASCTEEAMELSSEAAGVNPAPMTKVINTPEASVEGTLLLMLEEDAASLPNEELTALLSENLDVTTLRPVFRFPAGDRTARKYGLHRWFEIGFDGISNTAAAAGLASYAQVSKIQYNKLLPLASDLKTGVWTKSTATVSDKSLYRFNDPMLCDQWHYINTGDRTVATGAIEGADIAVKDAWRLTAGDPNIVVAIIDGPVKHTHEDLKNMMWVNNAEKEAYDRTGKGDGIDNDGNGYVDDVYGWNCDRDTCKIDWTVSGESGHGTHVAGTVAAQNNNGTGVCGVAGGTGNGDGVRIMSCQIFTGGVSANTVSAARAFVYAAVNGAHIAQCSFGYPTTTYTSDSAYASDYTMEYYAIQYFLDKDTYKEYHKNDPAGSVIDGNIAIFASGNDSAAQASYPSALADCISVTAFGPDFYPAQYTNYGPGCNIAAPGGDYYLNPETRRSCVLSTFVSEASSTNQDYAYVAGTSMACPHVSGVAALGLSYAFQLGRSFSREDFTSLLLTSVNDIDSRLTGGVKTQYDDYGNVSGSIPLTSYQYNMGTGAVDAWKFLMNIEGTPSLMVSTGKSARYSLTRYFGEAAKGLTYLKVKIDDESRKALGIETDPSIEYGELRIEPTKVGSGYITVTAIAGGDKVGSMDYIGGMEIERKISIVSRGVASRNGGWL